MYIFVYIKLRLSQNIIYINNILQSKSIKETMLDTYRYFIFYFFRFNYLSDYILQITFLDIFTGLPTKKYESLATKLCSRRNPVH
jgi:hypothetical protein